MKQISTLPPTSQRASKVASFIDRQLTAMEGDKTVAQVADEAGFPQRNIMSMIRKGTTKLPFERIRGMAEALHVDLAYLLDLALEEYQPALYELLKDVRGEVSANERKLIRLWRTATGDTDPSIDLARAEFVQFVESVPQLSSRPGRSPNNAPSDGNDKSNR